MKHKNSNNLLSFLEHGGKRNKKAAIFIVLSIKKKKLSKGLM